MWENLPSEIQSKIMFSGYIKHPISVIFNNFINNIIPLSADISDPKPSFIRHLVNIGILNTFVLDIDFLISTILQIHS